MRYKSSKPHQSAVSSVNAMQVASWFGLSDQLVDPYAQEISSQRVQEALPAPGQITLLTGASGSGKSSLLRALRHAAPRVARFGWCVDLDEIALPDRALVDCFEDRPLPSVLGLLSRVGLAEAWSFVRLPSQLSEGQRWRLRLALAIHQADRSADIAPSSKSDAPDHAIESDHSTLLLADEFAAVLDRVTASIVARTLRRTIDRSPHLAAIVATSHEDLGEALAPDRIVRCDFGDADCVKHEFLKREDVKT